MLFILLSPVETWKRSHAHGVRRLRACRFTRERAVPTRAGFLIVLVLGLLQAMASLPPAHAQTTPETVEQARRQ